MELSQRPMDIVHISTVIFRAMLPKACMIPPEEKGRHTTAVGVNIDSSSRWSRVKAYLCDLGWKEKSF